MSVDRFCQKLLIEHGRADEAYRRYGLRAASGRRTSPSTAPWFAHIRTGPPPHIAVGLLLRTQLTRATGTHSPQSLLP